MCGRFALTISPTVLARLFQLADTPSLSPRYNIAPGQEVTAILNQEGQGRTCRLFSWGLIPTWAKDPAMGAKLINARAETVSEKPAFRESFKNKRCLIPADGFYEWHKKDKTSRPYFIRMQYNEPFAFAGLWQQWQSPDQQTRKTCAILTIHANSLLEPIHPRMPVIIPPENYDLWLDTTLSTTDRLQKLLHPYPPEKMNCFAVSPLVNSPQHDSPQCIEPVNPDTNHNTLFPS
ncbi:MAG: SOS response-associated peptidase [Sedimentisphaerales bacterium]|nr:SOS response-associated peptidase [Sedimentisphaerales bacterium]